MAIDVPVPRPDAFARVAAVPARLLLAGIVAASFLVRFAAALGHSTPLYFPDEYIYSAISRSLAEHGRPVIRGSSAHFPAMVEPLLAAPFWLTHDPDLAYRLTQAENALAMSLAAIPAYLLMRKLGGGPWAGLVAAALTVASPDLFFSSFLLADAIAYPLVLGAVYLGVCALSRPTRATQLGFAGLAVLATFTRIQYVFLPLVFVGAALVVERGSVRSAWRRFRLSLVLYSAPLALAAVLGPRRLLGYYSGVADLHVRPWAIVHWLGTDSMLLAYAAGFALVPGALVGLAFALWRPRSREECGLAALSVGLLLCLFAEAALYATNGSDRFQERYLMILLPLVFPAFWLWLRRGRPAPKVVALIALALLVLSARVPLSGYTVSDAKQDSPFLLGVFRLEKAVGIGDGSLAVALGAAAPGRPRGGRRVPRTPRLRRGRRHLRGLVRGLDRGDLVRPRRRPVGAHHAPAARCPLDRPRRPRADDAHPDPGDRARARARAALLEPLARPGCMFLDEASPIDAFGSPRVRVAADGRLVSGSGTLRGPLAISNYAVRARLVGAVAVARGAGYELWRPLGTPRMAMFVGGLYQDGWLASSGHVTLWPASDGRVQGTLKLPLSLPKGTRRTVLQLHGPGVNRRVVVTPTKRLLVELPVSHKGPWTLSFHTDHPGYLQPDERPISVQAQLPSFSGSFCGTAPPGALA